MVSKWRITYTKLARKEFKKAASSGLQSKIIRMIEQLQDNPFYPPPPEKLSGDLEGFYSRRINKQHRLVYEVLLTDRVVKIARMWTHYE